MKTKIIMIFALTTLMLLTVAAPAMACPTGNQKVTATMYTIGVGPASYEPPTTKGNIMHYAGTTVYYNILVLGNQQFQVYSSNKVSGIDNLKTSTVVEKDMAVWSIPTQGSGNGFAGFAELRLSDYDPTTGASSAMTVHAVAQGFGTFRGQTLVLSYEGPVGGAWTGYCIKR